ncbi:hypothetical protein JHK87_001457 [Glycine soja]|nr:hypothetical protein JHK87_001457 [Glycine soja]
MAGHDAQTRGLLESRQRTGCRKGLSTKTERGLQWSATRSSSFLFFSNPRFCNLFPSSSKMQTLVCHFVNRLSLFPNTSCLRRTKSFEHHVLFTHRGSLRRACSASLEPFLDEEFAKKVEDLALKFQLSEENTNANDLDSKDFQEISLRR